jgi:hypothetical protein
MASHLRKRADRIKAQVPILSLLVGYGYDVRADGGDREQQFSCDLHGDGNDSKPSSRYYPESNSIYCWACGRVRDSIGLVQEKEGLKFKEAVKRLEIRFRLKPLPYEHEESATQRILREGRDALDVHTTIEDDIRRQRSLIHMVTQDRMLPMARCSIFWDALDKVAYMAEHKGLEVLKARQTIGKMRERLFEELAA